MKYHISLLLLSFTGGALSLEAPTAANQESLPTEAAFPGVWDKYIQAPRDKTFIRPRAIHTIEGDVEGLSDALLVVRQDDGTEVSKMNDNARARKWSEGGGQKPIQGPKRRELGIGRGGLVVFDFEENIAGRYALLIHFYSTSPSPRPLSSSQPRLCVARSDS